jgi:plasmid maintenance system antidote protein VapI
MEHTAAGMPPHPGTVVSELMQERGITKDQIADGGFPLALLNDILNGNAGIPLEHPPQVESLAHRLRCTPEYLVNVQTEYDRATVGVVAAKRLRQEAHSRRLGNAQRWPRSASANEYKSKLPVAMR